MVCRGRYAGSAVYSMHLICWYASFDMCTHMYVGYGKQDI